MEWEPNPVSENITEYKIYRAQYYDLLDSMGDFRYLTSVPSSSTLTAEYIDVTVLPGLIFYYQLRAIDDSDIKSRYSDSIAYSTFLPVRQETMQPNNPNELLGGGRRLSWSYDHHMHLERYCITILDIENNLIFRVISSPSSYVGGAQVWVIPDEVIFNDGEQYKWRVDLEADIMNGYEAVGAESPWATFKYVEE